MRILFIGDICGRPGRRTVGKLLPQLRKEFAVDFVIANAENAAGGFGATPEILDELSQMGVEAFTFGNHTWDKRVLIETIDDYPNVVRPANYPPGVPGKGAAIVRLRDGRPVGLVNVQGRVFMGAFDCPFRTAQQEIAALRPETNTIIVDIHAEATSEKIAMGYYLDGACTAVIGTHTHVPTADERVLPGGTAYITDVGMTGGLDGVIGVEKEGIIERFLTGLPTRFEPAKERPGLCAVVIETDDDSGKARSIERIMRLHDK